MSDESTLQQGGGEAVPAAETKAPTNDAQAAALEAQAPVVPAVAPDNAESRKHNRTKEYIARINRDRAELAQRVSEYEARERKPQPQAASDGEPTLAEHNFDPVAYQRAHSEWSVQKALKADRETQHQQEQQRKQQETHMAYSEKAMSFADEHPDFLEVVGSIPYVSDAVQLAIMARENGPEIAYHIAQNNDLVLQLASIPPQLAASAIDHIASRMTAAPQAPQQPSPIPVKPVSKAPPPVPMVSGKSPTETPAEKLTDSEWWARRKKRAS